MDIIRKKDKNKKEWKNISSKENLREKNKITEQLK